MQPPRQVPLLLALGLLGVLSSGCASPERIEPKTLPFHLAVLPVQVEERQRAELEEGHATELALRFDRDQLSQSLVTRLAERSFSKVSLLQPIEESPAAREASWAVGPAQAERADLLLEPRLIHDSVVRTNINDRFWLNLPLFALGGPATWFVNDRSYYFDATLEVRVYDLSPVALEDSRSLKNALLTSIQTTARESSLDFLDRARGNTGSFLLSILVPSGFLSKEGENVESKLEEQIVDDLCDNLVRELQRRDVELLHADRLVDFHPEGLRVATGPGGRRRLEGELVLEATADVARLGGFRYQLGNTQPQQVDFDLDSGVEDGDLVRYPVTIALDGAQADELIQIQVWDASVNGNQRSYTYAIPADPVEPR